MTALEVAVELCDDIAAVHRDRKVLPWMWGPALLGFALAKLDEHLGEDRYLPCLERYGDHYLAHPPAINYSDHVAPALVTWTLQRKGMDRFAPLTERAVDYIRHAPRAVDDAVNHLGRSSWNWIYPRSVWVDSLMMFSVFPAMYGRVEGDPRLLDVAARQPAQYARRMFDEESGLWHHAYWVRYGPFPNVFWGRGNGWVVAALPMILDQLHDTHPEWDPILELLQRTSTALLPLQSDDGTWQTVLKDRRRWFKSRGGYRELSATALVAAGWFHGVRRGYLGEEFLEPAQRALDAVTCAVRRRGGRVELPEISGPTIPLPFAPRLGYLLTPKGSNHPYGVAAFVLAAINRDLLQRAP